MSFEGADVLRMSIELALGVGIKLFIDNGRLHWRDFVNDFLFWLPGVRPRECDGLGWQVAQEQPLVSAGGMDELPLAAK